MESKLSDESLCGEKFDCFRLTRRLFRLQRIKTLLIVSSNHQLFEIAQDRYDKKHVIEYNLCHIDKVGVDINNDTSILTLHYSKGNKKSRIYEFIDSTSINECVRLIQSSMAFAKSNSMVEANHSINETVKGAVILMNSYYSIAVQLQNSFISSPSQDITLDMANIMTQAVNLMSDVEGSTEDWSEVDYQQIETDYQAIVSLVQTFLKCEDVQKEFESDEYRKQVQRHDDVKNENERSLPCFVDEMEKDHACSIEVCQIVLYCFIDDSLSLRYTSHLIIS